MSLLLAGTALSAPGFAQPAPGEPLNLPPIAMPTTPEECQKMIGDLLDDMLKYMGDEEFTAVFHDVPFYASMKADCEAGRYGSAYQTANGMRPTSVSPPAPQQNSSSSQSGGCFLTTACCELVGLPDDCFELTVLRRFRDKALARMPGGTRDIALYYMLAPAMLQALQRQGRQRALMRLYFSHILPCVLLAWLGFAWPTRRLYRAMMGRLYRTILPVAGGAKA
jgi:hypothetical protein